MKKYNVVVIGSGPGGLEAALNLKVQGKSVCVVALSRQHFGGVCLNSGCMPTKGYLKTAAIYRNAHKSGEFGLDIKPGDIDLNKIKTSVYETVRMLSEGMGNMMDSSGVDFSFGKGSLKSEKEVLVDKGNGETETLEADYIIIATGSTSAKLPFADFDGTYILNSDQLLLNTDLPERMLVIGGGAIGCEFATLYNSFGTKIKIVEAMDNLLPCEDKDVTDALKENFKSKGVDVETGTMVESLEIENGIVKAKYKDAELVEKFDKVLISTGRVPLTAELNLDAAGVQTDKNFIIVDEYLKTTCGNIYAVGDVIGCNMYAHSASYEGRVAAKNILNPRSEKLDERAVPRVVFTDPEIGSTGIVKADEHVKELYVPGIMKGRPVVERSDVGVMKIFAYKDSDTVAGASFYGKHATENIHQMVMAVQNRLNIKDIADTMFAHPTYAEPLADLASTGIES